MWGALRCVFVFFSEARGHRAEDTPNRKNHVSVVALPRALFLTFFERAKTPSIVGAGQAGGRYSVTSDRSRKASLHFAHNIFIRAR